MREIAIGETRIGVAVSAVTPFLYRKEFNTDMTSDLLGIVKGFASLAPGLATAPLDQAADAAADLGLTINDIGDADLNTSGILQLLWAMAKTAAYGKPWPAFEPWLVSLGEINLFDVDMITGVFEVASDGLFRGAKRETTTERPDATGEA